MSEGEVPGWGRYEWTDDRIAKIKEVADKGGTAVQAAIAVGLDPGSVWTIYKIAKREGIKFRNAGRPRNQRAIIVNLDDAAARELTLRARDHNQERGQFAARLLGVVLLEGPDFVKNILDEGN